MAAHPAPVEVGETIALTVYGPEELNDGRAVDVQISCRWSRQAPSGRGHLSGFNFEELAQSDLDVLNDWTEALGVDGEGILSS